VTPSPWLYAFLKNYEKFRPTAYKPTPKDVWTIGYGHTAGVKPGDTCTMDQANAFLASDIANRAQHFVDSLVHVPLTQPQYDALCSLVFNCGPDPLTLGLGKLLAARDYVGAGQHFLLYDKQAGVELPGLENRREAELARWKAAA
jgi:lysozyme